MSKLDLAFMMKKEGHFIPEVQKRIDLYVDKLNAELEQANKFLETANNSSIAMQNKCVELKRELDTAQESTRFYRNEWESACERLRYRDEELETARAEIERVKTTNKINYEAWQTLLKVNAEWAESSRDRFNKIKELTKLAQDMRDALKDLREGNGFRGEYTDAQADVADEVIARANKILESKNE